MYLCLATLERGTCHSTVGSLAGGSLTSQGGKTLSQQPSKEAHEHLGCDAAVEHNSGSWLLVASGSLVDAKFVKAVAGIHPARLQSRPWLSW